MIRDKSDNKHLLNDLILLFFKTFSSPTDLAADLAKFLKSIYDSTRNLFENSGSEMIIDGFDDEQLWQQVEDKNIENFDDCLSKVVETLVKKNKFQCVNKRGKEGVSGIVVSKEKEINNHDSADTDNTVEENEDCKLKSNSRKKPIHATEPVNCSEESKYDSADRFFDYRAMEKFLDDEDEKDMKKSNDKDGGFNGNDTYFESDEEECDNEMENNPTYSQFFDHPDSSNESNLRNNELEHLPQNSNNKHLENDSQYLIDEEQLDDDKIVEGNHDSRNLSDKLLKNAKKLEELALGEKPWQLKGEITSTSRPYNALLEEIIEFDASQRPAPIITNETTLILEDVIKQRIKDLAFDDVEKKIKPIKTPHEFKKCITLDQQKSKLSLAEIYEQEYMKGREAKDASVIKQEVESECHLQIKEKMRSIFSALDALSNFCYTPKPVIPEIKVISNIPAAAIEDVAPVLSADVNLLAPEEVGDKKSDGLLIAKCERTSTDKKRQIRKRKQFQGKMYHKLGKKRLSFKLPVASNLEKMKKFKNQNEVIV